MGEPELTHLAIYASEKADRWGRVHAFCGALVDLQDLARNGDPTCAACKRLDEADSAALKALIDDDADLNDMPVEDLDEDDGA
jgi:hypothetical protein